MKVAIVNDSVVALESLRRLILSSSGYELAWSAMNGQEAVQKCALEEPDIVLMDLVMPVMDGIEATRRICAAHGCAILVVTATVDGHTGKVFEAMSAGALDAVNTPVLGESGSGPGADVLLRKLGSIATLIRADTAPRTRIPAAAPREAGSQAPPLIAIGASTGGPAALRRVLGTLPAGLDAAVAVVQHVDEQFTASFADWLDQQIDLPVRLARHGDVPQPGTVLVCGREEHLVCSAAGRLEYRAEPRHLAYRPSVDVLFQSLAKNYTNPSLGILLTGMGRDGAAGLLALRERGWHTLAQDRDSCAVYGMPKAARELGAAAEILPIGDIGAAALRWLQRQTTRHADTGVGG